MSFPLYIAKRYTISKSKSTAVNIITLIAALGIFAGTAALFIIMSAFSGLKVYTVAFTNATDPELKITAKVGKSFFVTPQQETELSNTKGIANYSKIAEERVLFYFKGKEQVAYLKGTDNIYTKVNEMENQLVAGKWLEPNTIQAVVGIGTASKLSMGLFDFNNSLEVWVPKAGKGLINSAEDALKKASLVPMGIYSVNDDVNGKFVFCDLGLAQELLQFKPNQYTSLEFKLKPDASESAVREKLNAVFQDAVIIKNRAQQNESLYKMLNAENMVTYLFCSLVVIMTMFCLAGALIMLILDKKENIKTLFNLGAGVNELRNIFLYQGIFITTIGAGLGLLVSIAVVIIQQQYNIIMLGPIPYPVEFNFVNILIVVATIYVLGILASWIAAGRINSKLLEN